MMSGKAQERQREGRRGAGTCSRGGRVTGATGDLTARSRYGRATGVTRRTGVRFLLATACALLLPVVTHAVPHVWQPAASSIKVYTDRGGLFSRMAHKHEIVAQSFTGTLDYSADVPEETRLDLLISAKSLRVLDPGVDAGDVAKIQKKMESDVLEVEKYPEIRFRSNVVTREEGAVDGGQRVRVSGTLALHGTSQPVAFPLTITDEGGAVRFRGELTIRQKDYEIEPVSIGLGAVTVKNEVKIVFDVVARRDTATETPAGSAAGEDDGAEAPTAGSAAQPESVTAPADSTPR